MVVVSYLIHYETLLQNATATLLENVAKVYYIIRPFFVTNATVLLQNATVITKGNNFITKCGVCYKRR